MTPTIAEKPKPISKKVRAAIDALVVGDAKTVTAAADKAGLSREHLSRELSKPHVTEHLRHRVARSLAVASARAGAVKLELLDSDNAMVRDRASSFVLGLIGIKPDTGPVIHNGQQQPGMVIVINNGGPTPVTLEQPSGVLIEGGPKS